MINANEYERLCRQLMQAEQDGFPCVEDAQAHAEVFQSLRDYERHMLGVLMNDKGEFTGEFTEFVRNAAKSRMASKPILWRLHRLAGLDYSGADDPVIAEAQCDPALPRGAWCALARDLATIDESFGEQLMCTIAVHGQPSEWDELRYGRMYMLLNAVMVSMLPASLHNQDVVCDPYGALYERWKNFPHFAPVLAEFLQQQRESGVYTATPSELAEMLSIYHHECEQRRAARRAVRQEQSDLDESDAADIMQEAGIGVLGAGPIGTALGVPVPTLDEGELAEACYPGLGRIYGYDPTEELEPPELPPIEWLTYTREPGAGKDLKVSVKRSEVAMVLQGAAELTDIVLLSGQRVTVAASYDTVMLDVGLVT